MDIVANSMALRHNMTENLFSIFVKDSISVICLGMCGFMHGVFPVVHKEVHDQNKV